MKERFDRLIREKKENEELADGGKAAAEEKKKEGEPQGVRPQDAAAAVFAVILYLGFATSYYGPSMGWAASDCIYFAVATITTGTPCPSFMQSWLAFLRASMSPPVLTAISTNSDAQSVSGTSMGLSTKGRCCSRRGSRSSGSA
jgi:hypothetical protein